MSLRLMTRVAWIVAVFAAATAVGGAQGQSPAQPQPQLLVGTFVAVHPGMGPEYVEFQKNEVMAALRTAGVPGRQAWSSGAFGEGNSFAFFAPIASLAQFDGPGPIVKALGEQAAAALNARGAKMTVSRRVILVRTRPDLSYQPDPKGPPAPIALVSHVDTAVGRRGEFEALLKKEVLPLMQQARVRGYSVLEVIYGASAGTYYTTIAYDNYEALGKGHPFQIVLGEEGARRLEAKFTGIVTNLERFVARHRPDLSFWKAPSTN